MKFLKIFRKERLEEVERKDKQKDSGVEPRTTGIVETECSVG